MIDQMGDYQQWIEYLEWKSKISEVKIHWVSLGEYWILKKKGSVSFKTDKRILLRPNLKNKDKKLKINEQIFIGNKKNPS